MEWVDNLMRYNTSIQLHSYLFVSQCIVCSSLLVISLLYFPKGVYSYASADEEEYLEFARKVLDLSLQVEGDPELKAAWEDGLQTAELEVSSKTTPIIDTQ